MNSMMQRNQTIIHLVRHGDVYSPKWLRYGRLPGIHLSGEGRLQAHELCHYFLKRKITHIYSSPLERTQQTATILGLAFPYVDITLDARLLESKTAAKFEGKVRDLAFYYPLKSSSDAETAEDVTLRFTHFTEEKIAQHNGQEIVAVSHGDPISLAVSHYLYHADSITRGVYPGYASV